MIPEVQSASVSNVLHLGEQIYFDTRVKEGKRGEEGGIEGVECERRGFVELCLKALIVGGVGDEAEECRVKNGRYGITTEERKNWWVSSWEQFRICGFPASSPS